MDTLVYLYGIVPADAPEPPPELPGLEDRPVRLVRAGGVAAVVSDVPADAYGDTALEAHLGELEWVGLRGLAHERVVDWFAERGPVLPLSLFSLHADEARVAERLRGDAERYAALLESVRGRREWGVKLWRVESRFAEHVDELSPALRALAAEMEQAPPGRRFLLAKKRDALRADEMKRLAARVAHQVFSSLRDRADAATATPSPSTTPGDRVLALDGSFLVRNEEYGAFQQRLGELARDLTPVGFDFEFTGPWPPYHFVTSDG
jgi:hypothetical protein